MWGSYVSAILDLSNNIFYLNYKFLKKKRKCSLFYILQLFKQRLYFSLMKFSLSLLFDDLWMCFSLHLFFFYINSSESGSNVQQQQTDTTQLKLIFSAGNSNGEGVCPRVRKGSITFYPPQSCVRVNGTVCVTDSPLLGEPAGTDLPEPLTGQRSSQRG